ncbi:hypothetical protein Agub_g3667, partial [Astrephomene gubernaculifera]
ARRQREQATAPQAINDSSQDAEAALEHSEAAEGIFSTRRLEADEEELLAGAQHEADLEQFDEAAFLQQAADARAVEADAQAAAAQPAPDQPFDAAAVANAFIAMPPFQERYTHAACLPMMYIPPLDPLGMITYPSTDRVRAQEHQVVAWTKEMQMYGTPAGAHASPSATLPHRMATPSEEARHPQLHVIGGATSLEVTTLQQLQQACRGGALPPYTRCPRRELPSPEQVALLFSLHEEQARPFLRLAYTLLLEGIGLQQPPANVLITGRAGTGKSRILLALLWLAFQYDHQDMIAVTSYTHRGALEVSTPSATGRTTSSFF